MITLFRRLLHLLRWSRHDADLREEIEAHRALRQEAFERGGLAPEDAEHASRRPLGIGANTALFSIFSSLILRSLPVRDSGSLALLTNGS